ncbi:hypothetical protein SOVF_060240 isoform A [Spinacia oleracea]|nr:hypothetical protein SOVF_060240 isoform A [Spinacia oleracea]
MHLRRITRWTQHQADEVFISSRRIYCIARLGKILPHADIYSCQIKILTAGNQVFLLFPLSLS